MKKILLGATLIATFAATSAMAQGAYTGGTAEQGNRSTAEQGNRISRPAMTYTDSRFWSSGGEVRGETAAGASAPPVTAFAAPGATSAPYVRGDDIRNASSALWGVGG
jgi:hypothetical protein